MNTNKYNIADRLIDKHGNSGIVEGINEHGMVKVTFDNVGKHGPYTLLVTESTIDAWVDMFGYRLVTSFFTMRKAA